MIVRYVLHLPTKNHPLRGVIISILFQSTSGTYNRSEIKNQQLLTNENSSLHVMRTSLNGRWHGRMMRGGDVGNLDCATGAPQIECSQCDNKLPVRFICGTDRRHSWSYLPVGNNQPTAGNKLYNNREVLEARSFPYSISGLWAATQQLRGNGFEYGLIHYW